MFSVPVRPVVLLILLVVGMSQGAVVRLEIEPVPAAEKDPTLPATYEMLRGKVYGELDPGDRRNAIVQLYVKFPAVTGAPRIALRGFKRIHLDPGASQKVHFELKRRDLSMVTEEGHPIIAQCDYTIIIGGGQPETGAPGVSGHLHIDGQICLARVVPECGSNQNRKAQERGSLTSRR